MALCPRGARENLGPDSPAFEMTGSPFTDLGRCRTESFNYGPSVREENEKSRIFLLTNGQSGLSAI